MLKFLSILARASESYVKTYVRLWDKAFGVIGLAFKINLFVARELNSLVPEQ